MNPDIANLIAGGLGGCAGAVVISPLEVIKTRMQSSKYSQTAQKIPSAPSMNPPAQNSAPYTPASLTAGKNSLPPRGIGDTHLQPTMLRTLTQIYHREGLRALYKGIEPTLVGIIPSRAIYFALYNKTKTSLSESPYFGSPAANTATLPNNVFSSKGSVPVGALLDASLDTRGIGVAIPAISALVSSLTAATITNPLWVLRTRLQLNEDKLQFRKPGRSIFFGAPAYTADPTALSSRMLISTIVSQIYKEAGVSGFYKGLTASYAGASETMVQWVLYEYVKEETIRTVGAESYNNNLAAYTFFLSSFSKTIACLAAYPHEVIRTRMREPVVNGKPVYTGVFQSLKLIYCTEGARGLYAGLSAHVLRTLPNNAVVFIFFELISSHLSAYSGA